MAVAARVARGDSAIEELDWMLASGFEVGDVLHSTGVSYETLRRLAQRRNRPDLVTTLSDWKRVDQERLRRACGREWR